MLSYDEEDAIKRILRHHHVLDTQRLVTDLASFVEWVHQSEQAKVSLRRGTEPMPLLSLLGQLGIYGTEAIDKVRITENG